VTSTPRRYRPCVVLTGPSGSGKSTTGRVLAARLGMTCRDTDADVEANAGMTISDIFIEHGEECFRDLERRAVKAALAEHDGVLALGGGAVVDANTRAVLREHRVAFLDVGVAVAARRIGLNRARPMLFGTVRAQWLKLMADRRLLYEDVAAVTVNTDDRTVDEVADSIIQALGLTS